MEQINASNPYDVLTEYSGFLKNEWNSKKKLIANGEPGANKKKATRKRIVNVERQEYPKDSLRTEVEQKRSSILAPSMSSAEPPGVTDSVRLYMKSKAYQVNDTTTSSFGSKV